MENHVKMEGEEIMVSGCGIIVHRHSFHPRTVVSCTMALLIAALLVAGCPEGGGSGNGNGNADGDTIDMPDDGGDDGVDNGGGAPFAAIQGTELMIEGTRDEQPNGDTRRRDERFTATWSLRPTGAETVEVFIDDVLTTSIIGELEGEGRLTYEESGTDVTPELDCPTQNYEGSVQWDVVITGRYEHYPLLSSTRIFAQTSTVSSPEYQVVFTNPGCPEFDSQSPSNYFWQGPGQGTWGGVAIQLINGHFEGRLENPFFDDRGAEDFYEIEANFGAPQ